MKKRLFSALPVVMALALTACDSNDDTNETSQQEPSGETSQPEQSESSRELVKFPEKYDKGVNYTTVNRGDVREELYTSQEAIEAVQNGEPIPSGTVVTLEIYRDEELSEIFVMEKRTDWGDQNPPEMRNGDWLYQEFNGDRSVDYEEDIGRCFSCHANQERDDFLNTLDEMKSYELEDRTGSKDSNTESQSAGISTEDWAVKEIADNLQYPQGVHDEVSGLHDIELADNSLNESGKKDDQSGIMGNEEREEIVQKVLLMIYVNQLKNEGYVAS